MTLGHATRWRPVGTVHAVAAVLACVIVPGASWLDGSGSLAWTMYSKSETYRMRIVARRDDGTLRNVSPTELAVRSVGGLGTFLAGAETWRHAPVASTLARHLDDLAKLACAEAGTSIRSVDLTLESRRTLDAPIRTRQASRSCR